jgi:predicted ATP-grasp superfamily ATP-dependent carboligase
LAALVLAEYPINETTATRPRANAFDALILDAALRQSLVAVRSLGRRGHSVAALDAVEGLPAFSSRWCRHAFVCTAEDAATYRHQLTSLLDRAPAGVLIPSSDRTIAFLRSHRAAFEQRAGLAIAGEPALACAIDKWRTLTTAAALGVPVPRTLPIESMRDVSAAVRVVGLPAVVKPNESWVNGDDGSGVRVVSQVVTTMEEARAAVELLMRLNGVALFQPLLSGRREAVSFLFARKQVHARFAQWAKRTAPPLGGESVLRQSIAVPGDIGQHAERLVRAIDLEGYSEVEFRRDAAGTAYLMEINPRLSASVEIAVRSGVDFPYLLYQWASGGSIDTVHEYRTGGWMRHLRGDIMTTLASFRKRGRPEVPSRFDALLGFSASFFRITGYDYLDWQDPVPAVKATAAFVREAARGALKLAQQSRFVS